MSDYYDEIVWVVVQKRKDQGLPKICKIPADQYPTCTFTHFFWTQEEAEKAHGTMGEVYKYFTVHPVGMTMLPKGYK